MKRIRSVFIVFVLISAVLSVRLFSLINDDEIAAVSAGRGYYTLRSISEFAGIYDYNMQPLVNYSEKYEAVVIPNSEIAVKIQPYLIDRETFYNGITGNLPFLCRVSPEAYDLGDKAIIFRSKLRTDKNQLAPHIIGYTSDNVGMYGIEKAYDSFLRSHSSENSVTLGVDALGKVLGGIEADIVYSEPVKSGIITTLDKNIQQICENAAQKNGLKKGAVIVMDTKSGEIRAVVSCPDFNTKNISSSLNDPDSPFINRAFSAYSVGSIFKIVTAASALEQGISPEYSYICTGSANINGQIFNCHKWGGHGEIDMSTAMAESCNTYFIALSEYISKEKFIETASSLGFGAPTEFGGGITSASGNLQSTDDIEIPAERANMSFGQGMLTATPLQICKMTSAVANDGIIYEPSLIKGFTDENGNIEYLPVSSGQRVLSYKTARTLKGFMQKTVRAENSMSKPNTVSAGGKTSTAQTGRFDEQGSEIMNCWFSGYFPAYSPKYTVTILSEGGTSGNSTAGPIFRYIADSITEYEKSLTVD